MATTESPAATPVPDTGAELAGLDALSVTRRETESLPSRLRRTALPPLVAIAVALAGWELVVLLELKPAYAVPPPSAVWHTLTEQWAEGNVQAAVTNSLRRGVVGFLASVVIGTVIGMIVARVRPIRTAIKPILTGLQIMPSVAWVPAAIIWFGLSNWAPIFTTFMITLPVVASNISAPAFFRVIEEKAPTLLIDETSSIDDPVALRRLLRIGNTPGSLVLRHKKAWNVFGAKVICWRELPDDAALKQLVEQLDGFTQLLQR